MSASQQIRSFSTAKVLNQDAAAGGNLSFAGSAVSQTLSGPITLLSTSAVRIDVGSLVLAGSIGGPGGLYKI